MAPSSSAVVLSSQSSVQSSAERLVFSVTRVQHARAVQRPVQYPLRRQISRKRSNIWVLVPLHPTCTV